MLLHNTIVLVTYHISIHTYKKYTRYIIVTMQEYEPSSRGRFQKSEIFT